MDYVCFWAQLSQCNFFLIFFPRRLKQISAFYLLNLVANQNMKDSTSRFSWLTEWWCIVVVGECLDFDVECTLSQISTISNFWQVSYSEPQMSPLPNGCELIPASQVIVRQLKLR